jgi:hypothetical protein
MKKVPKDPKRPLFLAEFGEKVLYCLDLRVDGTTQAYIYMIRQRENKIKIKGIETVRMVTGSLVRTRRQAINGSIGAQ